MVIERCRWITSMIRCLRDARKSRLFGRDDRSNLKINAVGLWEAGRIKAEGQRSKEKGKVIDAFHW